MRHGSRGQASVELVALIPVLVGVVLLVWQLAVVVRASLVAQDRARDAALARGGSGTVRVSGAVRVPVLLPGVGELVVPFRGVVRGP